MDARLDQNQPKFGILVFAIPFKVFPNGYCLLDKEVKILGQLRGQTLLFQNSQHLVTSDEAHLRHTV